jgi:hypothetical protein
MQQTPRRRRQNQATHATDNMQQTADDMQEHASTCEVQQEHTAPPHFVRDEQRAAGKQQHARSIVLDNHAQHGTDATHKMQHATGAAACSKPTRNRHHAAGIETYQMRRPE